MGRRSKQWTGEIVTAATVSQMDLRTAIAFITVIKKKMLKQLRYNLIPLKVKVKILLDFTKTSLAPKS